MKLIITNKKRNIKGTLTRHQKIQTRINALNFEKTFKALKALNIF